MKHFSSKYLVGFFLLSIFSFGMLLPVISRHIKAADLVSWQDVKTEENTKGTEPVKETENENKFFTENEFLAFGHSLHQTVKPKGNSTSSSYRSISLEVITPPPDRQ